MNSSEDGTIAKCASKLQCTFSSFLALFMLKWMIWTHNGEAVSVRQSEYFISETLNGFELNSVSGGLY
jgi:hypothetical protein